MVKNLKNLIIVIVVLALISVGVVYFIYNKDGGADVLSAQKAAEKAISFINQNMLPGGITASLISPAQHALYLPAPG